MKRVFVELERCLGCKSCEIACAVAHSNSKNLFSAIFEKPTPKPRIRVASAFLKPIPISCRHCDEPFCVNACMTDAMKKIDGKVLCDERLCVGCFMCVMVCPYGALFESSEGGKVIKCDLCVDLDEPACVSACPTKALSYIDVSTFSQKRREAAAKSIILEVRDENLR